MLRIVFVLCNVLLLSHTMSGQMMQHTEMLARPTSHGVLVHCIFSQKAEMSVVYGTQSGVYTAQSAWIAAAADSSARIQLEGLTEDTKYYYRVCYRKTGAGDSTFRPEHSFHTCRKPSSEFSFVIQADPHMDENSDSTLYKRCLQNQLDDQPDFMIDLGDILMSDKLKNSSGQLTHDTVTSRCHLLRTLYETSCHSVPLMISLGNHEGESGWNLNGKADNVAVWGTNDRKKYFPNPKPDGFYTGDTIVHPFVGQRENYYAWQWGDAMFIVLDPYWYTAPKPDADHGWRWTLGTVQYEWLKRTLEQKTATYCFVFAHQIIGGDANGRGGGEFANLYEWGGKNKDGTDGWSSNRPGWYKPIKELFKEHRVTAFFHGHDHFFGQQQKECLIYQECPQPSLPNYQNANQAEEYGYIEGTILPNAGHLRVNVKEEAVRVDYVRAYLPTSENATRHNKDISATYSISKRNCYDSLVSSVPILWNSDYVSELISPNPSAGDSRLDFQLPTAQHISVHIYDENGHLVRTLLENQWTLPGSYTILWDSKNASGDGVASGTYIWELEGTLNGRHFSKLLLGR